MAVDIDQTRALRDLNALRGLVEAVVAADPSDELDWIEWKADVDLATKDGAFKIAKAVLGMANRLPVVAELTCEGCGYVVIGAEPETLGGIAMVDPAQWTPRVERYTAGAESPRWSPTTVPVQGTNVLVITVEPPRDGDAIWPLRNEYTTGTTTYRSGTVFVRKKGLTVPAEANDVDALVARSRASSALDAALQIELVGATPLPWVDQTSLSAQIRAAIAPQREAHLQSARSVEAKRNPPSAAGDLFEQQSTAIQNLAEQIASQSLTAFGPSRDRRTLGSYESQLQAWAEQTERDLAADLPRRWAVSEWSVVRILVTNLSTKYLPGVAIQLHIENHDVIAIDNAALPDEIYLPEPPREFGKPEPHELSQLLTRSMFPYAPLPSGLINPGLGDWNLVVDDDGQTVTFDVGNLRPERSEYSDEFSLLVKKRPSNGVLTIRWSATFERTDGLKRGTLDIGVEEAPTDATRLLDLR